MTQSGHRRGIQSFVATSAPATHDCVRRRGGYFIDVQGTANLTYRLQRAPSLTGPWTTSAPQTAPASGLIEFRDLFLPTDRAFYRAVQQ